MRLTRKIQRREAKWATVAIPQIVLRAWDGFNSVTLSWNPEDPDLLLIRPIVAGDDVVEG